MFQSLGKPQRALELQGTPDPSSPQEQQALLGVELSLQLLSLSFKTRSGLELGGGGPPDCLPMMGLQVQTKFRCLFVVRAHVWSVEAGGWRLAAGVSFNSCPEAGFLT